MEDLFNENIFNENEIADQEGLLAVGQLFNYMKEALEVAVEWLYRAYKGDRTKESIRATISSNVQNYNLDDIMKKFSAINTVKGDK